MPFSVIRFENYTLIGIEPHERILAGAGNSVTSKTRGDDKGWVLRQVNENSQPTGRLIQYHPGSRRKYSGNPYWKISDGASTYRFPAKK